MEDFKVYQASGYLTKLVTDASDVRKTYEEISGSLVEFDTPISAPLAELLVDINPVQSGTGDPSPTNIRPITGWTGANIYHSGEDTSDPTTYTISWQDDAGTVYGGTVDFTRGVLTITHAKEVIDASTSNVSFRSMTTTDGVIRFNTYGFAYQDPVRYYIASNESEIWCDSYKPQYNAIKEVGCIWVTAGGAPTYYSVVGVTLIDQTINTIEDADAYITNNPITLVLKLRYPITIQLTPQEINTLIGVNNIWADTGDVSVKYRTH